MSGAALSVVGISGSPSPTSKSRVLLEHALAGLAASGVATRVLDLAALPAEDLLGRSRSAAMRDALGAVAAADVVVVSTPVYRATYSGLLKVFFDQLPQRVLVGKVAVAVATGGVPGHQLVLDHGLGPLLRSLGALVVPTGVYGTDAQFPEGAPELDLLARLDRATSEAVALAGVTGQTDQLVSLES